MSETENITLRFYLTDKDVGPIIGRNGSRIRTIQDTTRTEMQIHGKIGGERSVTITGAPSDTISAVRAVAELLHKRPESRPDLDQSFENRNRNALMLLELPFDGCIAVIGRSGSAIKSLTEKGNTKIVMYLGNRSTNTHGIVSIEGLPVQISNTLSYMLEYVKDFLPHNVESSSRDSQNQFSQSSGLSLSGMSNRSSQTLFIDNAIAGVIVGKRGSNIIAIRKASKAVVQVQKNENRTDSALVISGDPSSMALAMHLIELKVNTKYFENSQRIDSVNRFRPTRSFNRQSNYSGPPSYNNRSNEGYRRQDNALPLDQAT